ncbi:MAG: hypothetical protein P4L83_00860 [Nevskia sp.]|nr:hypothetical protein [Nevskia sp.]
MRSTLLILLLAGLACQPALAGPWGRHDDRRPPDRPQPRFEPQRPQPRFEPQRPPAYGPPPQRGGPPGAQMPPQQQFRPISTGEAAHRAQQINGGGRVLAVDPADSGYRVRVLKNGEVRSVYVPGR